MTEVLCSASHFGSSTPRRPSSSSSSSPSSPSSLTCLPSPALSYGNSPHGPLLITMHPLPEPASSSPSSVTRNGGVVVRDSNNQEVKGKDNNRSDQLSFLALLVTLFRKSFITCMTDRRELCSMDIGWPTDVRHVAHVTFDRFNGFLGLPDELEPELPRRVPSASTTVFGVSTESMQLSYDSRGNSVPTILLLLQERLYAQGGLQAEGIFRINGENSQEEHVRDQLNRGEIPEGVDVHCLAGLIKAWFRELPRGVLDSLSPEQVMQCQTEEECAGLVRLLPPTEAALLDWSVNMMADVAQQEHLNKMNARNIAMVFAPNMTQMADPLNALMYAVKVMNFLKTLILRKLKEREDYVVDPPAFHPDSSDDNESESPSQPHLGGASKDGETSSSSASDEELVAHGAPFDNSDCTKAAAVGDMKNGAQGDTGKCKIDQSCSLNVNRGAEDLVSQQSMVHVVAPAENAKGTDNISRIDTWAERLEAWR